MAASWGRWVTHSTCLVRLMRAIFLGHLLGGPAGHAGVHLVEHHGAHLILLRQDVFHGQHDAGQLAAGGDLVDGAQLLAHVGGHQEAYLVHAVFRQGLLRKADGEANLAHVQLPQLREDLLLQPSSSLVPGLGQALRRLTSGLFCLLQLLFQVQQRVSGVLDLVQLPAAAGLVLQHLLHRGAVFLFFRRYSWSSRPSTRSSSLGEKSKSSRLSRMVSARS